MPSQPVKKAWSSWRGFTWLASISTRFRCGGTYT